MENYLIYDIPEQMVIASHISTYLINKFSYNVLIITKETIDRTHFKELGNDGKIKLSLIVAGDLKTLLKKLLYLDNLPASRLPRLLILDSLVCNANFIKFYTNNNFLQASLVCRTWTKPRKKSKVCNAHSCLSKSRWQLLSAK